MQLQVISPEEKHVYDVAWVQVYTQEGSFIVQPGHAPMVLVLAPHKSLEFRLQSGKQDSIVIPAGIMEISRTQVTVLMNVV